MATTDTSIQTETVEFSDATTPCVAITQLRVIPHAVSSCQRRILNCISRSHSVRNTDGQEAFDQPFNTTVIHQRHVRPL